MKNTKAFEAVKAYIMENETCIDEVFEKYLDYDVYHDFCDFLDNIYNLCGDSESFFDWCQDNSYIDRYADVYIITSYYQDDFICGSYKEVYNSIDTFEEVLTRYIEDLFEAIERGCEDDFDSDLVEIAKTNMKTFTIFINSIEVDTKFSSMTEALAYINNDNFIIDEVDHVVIKLA